MHSKMGICMIGYLKCIAQIHKDAVRLMMCRSRSVVPATGRETIIEVEILCEWS